MQCPRLSSGTHRTLGSKKQRYGGVVDPPHRKTPVRTDESAIELFASESEIELLQDTPSQPVRRLGCMRPGLRLDVLESRLSVNAIVGSYRCA